MAKCDQCGNEYDRAFKVVLGDRTMTFDSFECAIAAMAPRCAHCGCAVIGHGVETGEGKSSAVCIARSRKGSKISKTVRPAGPRLDFEAIARNSGRVSKSAQENSGRTDRRKRLAEALKANIKRRKDQLRARGQRAAKPADNRAPAEEDPALAPP